MGREFITSRSNPLVARIRKLNSKRSFRREEGLFVGEGPKLLAEAIKWGAQLETVVCTSDAVLPELPESDEPPVPSLMQRTEQPNVRMLSSDG